MWWKVVTVKQCPICGASAFDDARVCYGCLHRFDSDEPQDFDHSFPQEKDEASALTQKIGGIPAGVASVDVSDDAMSIVIRLSSPLSRAAKE